MPQNKLPEDNTNRTQEPLSVFSFPPKPGWTLLLHGSSHEWTLGLTWKNSSCVSGCQHMVLMSLTHTTHDAGSEGRCCALAIPPAAHKDRSPAPGEAPQGASKSVKQKRQSGKAPLSAHIYCLGLLATGKYWHSLLEETPSLKKLPAQSHLKNGSFTDDRKVLTKVKALLSNSNSISF